MDTYNLLIALIVLTCLLIVFFTIYLVNHHVRRQRKPALQEVDLENNTPAHAAQARPDTLHEHYDEQQRLSHITTVAPSIELLPEIRTSSERAENWLERSDSQVAKGDLGLKMHKVAGTKSEGPTKWDWRGGKDRGEGRKKKKKDGLEKGAGVLG
jgi:hypothetical protein